MEQHLKDELLERFRAYLDGAPDQVDNDGDTGDATPAADLYTLHVELAGLRSEVRSEARLIKDALDLFRGLVDRTTADQDAARRDIERLRTEVGERERAVLRPLLLDLLDLRDRLAVGLVARRTMPWYVRLGGGWAAREEAWREGLRISLARLDRLLREREVVMLELLGRPFDATLARAVATVDLPGRPNGEVTEELRPGFSWRGAVLRPAEVAVNKRDVNNSTGKETTG